MKRKPCYFIGFVYNWFIATLSKERGDQSKNDYTLFYYCTLNCYLSV